jgi:hypothetical protein
VISEKELIEYYAFAVEAKHLGKGNRHIHGNFLPDASPLQ